ncbi:PAS domain-containing sensor histidine kinase [Hymenobacter cellulosilyticus]|uniref:histidine kinase n=1 Tax=Hymenobacter cellulosilyticus TaxID=2932248 RepID=A0A8T9QFB4_9BACT|nr:PAS domain-containing sensor histidine kinase [Hymenobacter cellulosilyticus]UOQ74858.1 PAS domain-containing sensor histidine kinase [Hymenobacter cellulosilyticus]
MATDSLSPTPGSSTRGPDQEGLEQQNSRLQKEQAENQAQRETDQHYQRSQDRFRTVFENSPLGQKIIDPNLKILQANQALATMLGLGNADQVVGRRILEFSHPDHLADWTKLQQRLWAHKEPSFVLETCLVRPDGSTFWCRVTSVLFPDDGGELGYTTLEDITERKQLEAGHKRLYDAQETILQLAAHDLKSPLYNIEMVVDILRDNPSVRGIAPPSAQQDVQELLTLIEAACKKANTLLKDVLFLGQLESTRSERHRTNLGTFLEESLVVFRVTAREKKIDLILECPPEPVYADIHAEKFGRILDNLLSNAFKFTPAGGKIRVTLRQHEGRTRLTVHDTGLGIPQHLQPHVFEKFTSASRPGLYGDTTTGLGLFITKQIVELHEGQIWLESKENEGTTFFIDLA